MTISIYSIANRRLSNILKVYIINSMTKSYILNIKITNKTTRSTRLILMRTSVTRGLSRSLLALYLCNRLKSSPKTHDHVTNDHVKIVDVDIQKLAFDIPSTRCSCHNLKQLYLMLTFYREMKYTNNKNNISDILKVYIINSMTKSYILHTKITNKTTRDRMRIND
jgi:hypothetical protein